MPKDQILPPIQSAMSAMPPVLSLLVLLVQKYKIADAAAASQGKSLADMLKENRKGRY